MNLKPLAAFAVFLTVLGLFLNWDVVGTAPWWSAVAGGALLAVVYMVSRSGAIAGTVLLAAMAAGSFFRPTLNLEGMFNGLGVGFLTAICAGLAYRNRGER